MLRIYIHYRRYREQIIEQLEAKDLLFTLAPHRFLWQQIITIENHLSEPTLDNANPLLGELHNRCLDFPSEMKGVTQLFHLDEKTQEDIFRADIRVAEAIASLEQVNYQKRQIYCTEQLQNLNPVTDKQLMEYYYQEIQTAVLKIRRLEQIRLDSSQDSITQ